MSHASRARQLDAVEWGFAGAIIVAVVLLIAAAVVPSAFQTTLWVLGPFIAGIVVGAISSHFGR